MIIVRNHSETSQPLSVSKALVITSSNISCLPPHICRLQEVYNFPRSQQTQTSVISLKNPPLNRGFLSKSSVSIYCAPTITPHLMPLCLTLRHYASPYAIMPHLMPLCLTLRHYASPYAIMPHLMPLCLTLCHYASPYAIMPHLTPLCLTLRHYASPYAIMPHLMPLCLTLRHYASPYAIMPHLTPLCLTSLIN